MGSPTFGKYWKHPNPDIGKRLHSYGKSPCLGKSTNNMVIFNSYVTRGYQMFMVLLSTLQVMVKAGLARTGWHGGLSKALRIDGTLAKSCFRIWIWDDLGFSYDFLVGGAITILKK
jgi:hypothetical protein